MQFCTQSITDRYIKSSFKNIKTLYFKKYKQYNNIYNSLYNKINQYINNVQENLPANNLNNLQRVN